MTRHLTLVLGALLLAAPAHASLALTLCTAERCILASDSRTWDTVRDVAGGDTARKVDVRAGYAFVMTGWPGVFAAWTATTPRPGESAEALARRVLAAVVPDDEGQEAAIGILRFGASLDAYVAKVTIAPDGATTILEDARPAPPFAFTLGWDDGGAARDGLVQVTQRELQQTTPTEARLLEIATGILTAAARQSVKVGGPSHVAILDAAGARWLTTTRHGEHWDGTNLSIVSQNITIDQSGVRITPSTGTWIGTTNGYTFDAGSDVLGLYAFNGAGTNVLMTESWASATPAKTDLLTGYGGSNSAPSNYVWLSSTVGASYANFIIQTNTGSGLNTGIIGLGGIPNFQGATSGSAGSLAGYVNIQVGGTNYRLPVYNP
ncbi:MAG: hypothetical protein IT177_11610 [Acidobacteria bacterium]|nr:hypothetical protein [Acidobacteriota bacterium]